jgi:hypothetical protein
MMSYESGLLDVNRHYTCAMHDRPPPASRGAWTLPQYSATNYALVFRSCNESAIPPARCRACPKQRRRGWSRPRLQQRMGRESDDGDPSGQTARPSPWVDFDTWRGRRPHGDCGQTQPLQHVVCPAPTSVALLIRYDGAAEPEGVAAEEGPGDTGCAPGTRW